MTDILFVLPEFSTTPFSHLLPSLSKATVTTSELLTLSPIDIARRAQLPPVEVSKLTDALLEALHSELKETPLAEWQTLSLLDSILDKSLGGGIPSGYLTEITGESGVGKTQFLLTTLLSIQLPPPHGLSKSAIYISTESALSTSRLAQLLETHPQLCSLPEDQKPSLSRVLAIRTPDLESQDHILRYQVPVAIERHNVGLVVIDSIASNYRAEFGPTSKHGAESPEQRPSAQAMAERRTQLVQLGSYLRDLARRENVAIILSNQVADRFDPTTPYLPPDQPSLITSDPLTLDHQQKWFTGWGDIKGDYTQTSLKTPSLGLVWTNQISARIALVLEPHIDSHTRKRRRWLRIVFASWAAQTPQRGIEYEIAAEGVTAVGEKASYGENEN